MKDNPTTWENTPLDVLETYKRENASLRGSLEVYARSLEDLRAKTGADVYASARAERLSENLVVNADALRQLNANMVHLARNIDRFMAEYVVKSEKMTKRLVKRRKKK